MIAVMALGGNAFAMQNRVEQSTFARLSVPVAQGVKLRIPAVPLADANDTQELELERFEVWAPDAVIEIFGENGKVERAAPPAIRYFRGKVTNDEDSLVYLSVDEKGRVAGLIVSQDKRYTIHTRLTAGRTGSGPRARTEGAGRDEEVIVEETSVLDEMEQAFTCDVEKKQLHPATQFSPGVNTITGLPRTEAVPSGTQVWALNLAIETDYELFQKAGSEANVRTYMANVVGAVSTIYRRDLSTELHITYLGVHTTSTDPFNVVPGSTIDALNELSARWHNTPPANVSRSSTILFSGKSLQAGVAWVGTMCGPDFFQGGIWGGAYAYCGGITPPAGLVPPSPEANAPTYTLGSNYWPVLQLAHELGHNVGSDHTHCVSLTAQEKAAVGVTRNFVDVCYNGEAGSGCSGDAQSVPAEKGTIMSYCHLLGPSNSRYIFGKTNEASAKIVANMTADIQGRAPALSAITAPATGTTGTAAAASVTNVAGMTYNWLITNGVINGSSSGSSISFTPTAHPVVLKVKATNASGCSVTDTKSITVQTSCTQSATFPYTTVSYLGQAMTVNVTAGCAWTASSNVPWIVIPVPNGTGNGTFEVQVSANMNSNIRRTGIVTFAGQQITITQFGRTVRGDFNGDGRSDLILRNTTTGANKLWLLDHGVLLSEATLPSEADQNWNIIGSGDFNGDDFEDLIWRNTSTGANRVWYLRGPAYMGTDAMATVPLSWTLSSVFRYGVDDTDNLAWRNVAGGNNVLWYMTGTTLTATTSLPAVTASVWQFKAMTDLNNDGWSDLIWHNSFNGDVAVWFLAGNELWYMTTMGNELGANMSLVATGDFDSDGWQDTVWRNSATGANTLWRCGGGQRIGTVALPSATTDWKIVGPR
ncbi:MAG TPA: M12 family metallo-peptidase [Thermoanaerobaculia bacterium]